VVRDVRNRGSNKECGIYCYFVDTNVRRMIGTRILTSIGSRLFYLTPPPRSILGHAVAQFVEALRYKRVRFQMVPLECFIDTMTLRSAQSLIEMSTRNISWGVKAAGG